MSDPSQRIDVASVELSESYGLDGKPTRFLNASEFRLAYEADTDKLVVQKKGSLRIHVIPWANVNGFELATQAVVPARKPEKLPAPTPEQVAHWESEIDREATAEAADATRSATRGGSRRTRPTP